MSNTKMFIIPKTFQKGVSIYLAFMVMTILLAISLGLSVILIGQMKMIRGMGDSVIAFYAAETGIERVLYEDKICRQSDCFSPPCSGGCDGLPSYIEFFDTLDNKADYRAIYEVCPDFNGDGIVDMEDTNLIIEHFGETPASPNWDSKFDLVEDDLIDMSDITFVNVRHGFQCYFSIFKSSGEFKNTKRAIQLAR